MMIKVVTFTILVISILLLPRAALAHILATDGSVGAVLHIDPDDDPIAGQQAGFFFEFKDKDNKFQAQNCSCMISVIEDGKPIFSRNLFSNNPNPTLTNSSFFYTFPERNVYQVKIAGQPFTPGSFKPFSLVYNIRVARIANVTNQTNPSGQSWLLAHAFYILGGLVVLVLVGFTLIKRKDSTKPPKTESKEPLKEY